MSPTSDSDASRNTSCPRKRSRPALKLVDIAGIVKGASDGEGLGNKFLSHIRQVDAIVQVVRCFEDPDVVHVAGAVDPISDIETVETELMLADIQTLENALGKAERTARSGDKEAKLRVAVIEKCNRHLETDSPLRTLELGDAEKAAISSYGLMTAKPVLYVANVDENDLEGKGSAGPESPRVRREDRRGCGLRVREIGGRDCRTRRTRSRGDAGRSRPGVPALSQIAREAYRTLGLQSYFTAGEKEVRAWTVPIGATAPQAAGVIHTDFERGFIRAEVYTLEDLETYKTEKEIRQAGKLRIEGKNYVMQDGDICHFLFNV